METLSKLNKTFSENTVLSGAELNLLVGQINTTIDFINNQIKTAIEEISSSSGNNGNNGANGSDGAPGLDGISTLMAFAGATDAEAALIKLGSRNLNAYPPGQFSINSNVSLLEGEVLFMTSARKLGNTWLTTDGYIWSVPVLLGSSNTTSTTGVDTENLNYIYCRTTKNVNATNSSIYPSDSLARKDLMNSIEDNAGKGFKWNGSVFNTINDLNTNDPDYINGTWTDHPYGISEDFPHEWMVGYKRNETTGYWEYYFGPIMISNYGYNGLDGDGLEYIFKLIELNENTPTLTAPYTGTIGGVGTQYNGVTVASETYLLDDFIPFGWNDEPGEVTSVYTRQYISTRKRTGDLEGDKEWGAFTTPRLWSTWSADGGHYEFIYINFKPTENNLTPTKPANGTSIENLSGGWSRTATSPDFANGYFTWMSQCFVSGEGTYGIWTDPIRITGEDGDNGTDGDMIEFIYTRNNTGTPPSAPPSNGTYPKDWPRHDENGTSVDHNTDGNNVTWYDNPQGVANDMKYEYISTRSYDGTSKTWSNYSTPVVWSKWGEKGMDGDGYEYIFRGFSAEVTNWASYPDDYPPNWTNNSGFNESEYYGPVGHTWSDDPVSVDSTNNRFVYVSVRKRKEINGISSWQQYSIPALWALYVAPGTTGLNGSYTLFIYKTTSDTTVSAPSTSDSNIPSGWSALATIPINNTEHIWCCSRIISYNINNVALYGTWGTPYKISGQDGVTTVVYQIAADVAEIRYKQNHAGVNTWTPNTVNISIFKFEGTSFTEISSLSNTGITINGKINGTNSISVSLGSNNSSAIATYSGTIGNSVEIYLEDSNNNKLCSIKLPIIREYLRMLIPMGAYTDKEYTITDTTIPLVLGSDGIYYYLDADTNKVSGTNVNPTTSGLTVWAAATEYEVILTNMLFAAFAKLGSFVIYGDYFFSQYGTLYYNNSGTIEKTTISGNNYATQFGNKVPYGWFDSSDPLVENNPTTGNYKFKPTKGINAKTGEEWGANGNIYMTENLLNVTGNIVANTLSAGTAPGMRIITENNQIQFINDINTPVARFEINGNGLELYIVNSEGIEYKVNWGNWLETGNVSFSDLVFYTSLRDNGFITYGNNNLYRAYWELKKLYEYNGKYYTTYNNNTVFNSGNTDYYKLTTVPLWVRGLLIINNSYDRNIYFITSVNQFQKVSFVNGVMTLENEYIYAAKKPNGININESDSYTTVINNSNVTIYPIKSAGYQYNDYMWVYGDGPTGGELWYEPSQPQAGLDEGAIAGFEDISDADLYYPTFTISFGRLLNNAKKTSAFTAASYGGQATLYYDKYANGHDLINYE